VTTLRVRPDTIALAPEHAGVIWTLRVQSAEAWDAVRVDVVPDTSVRDVKQAALATLMPDVDDVDAFVIKLRGAEIHDESLSVRGAGAIDGSTLLIMSRRRRPVR
jgi:hypothetical protein